MALIIINLAAMTLESVPSLAARYHALFELIEICSLVLFSAEYWLRIWVAAEHAPHMRLSPAQLAALIEGLDWTRVHVPRVVRPQATQ